MPISGISNEWQGVHNHWPLTPFNQTISIHYIFLLSSVGLLAESLDFASLFLLLIVKLCHYRKKQKRVLKHYHIEYISFPASRPSVTNFFLVCLYNLYFLAGWHIIFANDQGSHSHRGNCGVWSWCMYAHFIF